ncbi:hypothetical protein CRV01_09675 [Arcobacter sp. CECT 8983]|uniref:hypothetical protein n=1 Tax=Arcobacter sp. CECT 8983 TaxID=2044508 RepID=UPI00100AE76F|nr:hypothetical protein [Arcobacter sp. CECT 8983]RXJ88880.1 hypothetical protein CRV01_09675 [Arcobacter sp. CECT 8983]
MKSLSIVLGIVISLFIFTGCAVNMNNINNVSKKEAYSKLNEITMIGYKKGTQIKYRRSTLAQCKVDYKLVTDKVLRFAFLQEKFMMRDIDIKFITNNSEPISRVLIVRPALYNCVDKLVDVEVTLYDIEEVSQKWKNQEKKDSIKDLTELNDSNIIYRKVFTLKQADIMKKDSEFLAETIIKALSKVIDLPKVTKDLETVQKEQALKYTNCDNAPSEFGLWQKNNGTLCIGNIGLQKAKRKTSKSNSSILNVNTGQQYFKINNTTCKDMVLTYAKGKKEDKEVSLKSSYKNQILKYYDNKCKVEKIDELNFISCKTDKTKDYYLENSKTYENRIYDKSLVQMDEMCFDKLKETYALKKDTQVWQTIYGSNSLGWDTFGFNSFTKTKYDMNGYDINGWSKEGINKLTNTRYDKNGFTKDGDNKYGVDKDGWSPILKKFVSVKSVKGNNNPSFKVKDFISTSKNEIYNRSNYDNVYLRKETNGMRLIGEKVIKNNGKKVKVKKYIFDSNEKDYPIFNLKNPKGPIYKSIKLEKIVEEKIN